MHQVMLSLHDLTRLPLTHLVILHSDLLVHGLDSTMHMQVDQFWQMGSNFGWKKVNLRVRPDFL